MVAKTGTSKGELIEGEEGNDWLSGEGGSDRLFGYGANDILYGGADRDFLYGGWGLDTLYGGTGNDSLLGEAGDDDLYGEDGVDTIRGDAGRDYAEGGDGNDTIDGGGDDDGTVTIQTTAGAGITRWTFQINTVFGGLFGGSGIDTINGGAGNDIALGGYDRDYLYGDGDNDVLVGGAGGDLAEGGEGNDVLVGDTLAGFNFPTPIYTGGQGGDDELYGGAADDLIYGGAGTDIIQGDAGLDALYGAMGPETDTPAGYVDLTDTISGGAGDDLIRGGDGDDQLFGEEDEDNIRGDRGNDLIDGGAADDLVAYRFDDVGLTTGARMHANNIGLSESMTLDDGIGGIDTLVSIERIQIVGSAFDDDFNGGQNGDFLYARGGNDLMFGLAGDDILRGEDGDDRLDGGRGDDEIDGGTGTDTAFYGLYDYDPVAPLLFDARTFTGVGREMIRGALIGEDWLTAIELIEVRGGGNLDQITGSQIGDIIAGLGGDDTLDGQGGGDTIDGGVGRDTIDGGDGDDVIDGGDEGDTIRGGAGDDQIGGGAGIDRLDGGEDNDRLDGEGENDILRGGAGDDVLEGGAGTDKLYGGEGDDFYSLAEGDEADEIYEGLGQGDDMILSAISLTIPKNVEDVELLAGGTVIGNELSNEIDARYGDTVTLRGGRGDDILKAGNGADILDGGAGRDRLYGGKGDDFYVIIDDKDWIEEYEDEGIDTVLTSVNYEMHAHVENVDLNVGAVSVIGNDLDNTIIGNAVANTLRGEDGDDRLSGGAGRVSDVLTPGDGKDTILADLPFDSTSTTFDLIVGLNLNEDMFSLSVRPTSVATFNGGPLRTARFDRDLRLAMDGVLDAGGAVLFNPSKGNYEGGGMKFLVVDGNGIAGYQAGEDYVFGLRGVTGALSLGDFV